jgi:RND family efflux transporter MFP subunit
MALLGLTKRKILPGVAGALLVWVACSPAAERAPNSAANAAANSSDSALLRVTRGDVVRSAVALGSVRAQVGAEVRVGPRVSGVVTELPAAVGQRVERGALLARLDDRSAKARLASLTAQLAAAWAESEWAAAQAVRAERLAGVVAEADRDTARRDARVRAALVERLGAEIDEARLDLGFTELRAPVAGTVASVSTTVGETVAASFQAPTFLTLIDLDRLEVRALVDETDIGSVRSGQTCRVRIDAFRGLEFEGVVRAIDPKAQLVQNVVNYAVTIDLERGEAGREGDGREAVLRPDMTVHVDFVLERRTAVLLLPPSAIVRRGGEDRVLVLEGDRVIERVVRLGLATPRQVEVLAGVVEGEAVVADALARSLVEEGKPRGGGAP